MTERGYFKQELKVLLQSLEVKKILVAYGYDLLFYATLFCTFLVWALTVRATTPVNLNAAIDPAHAQEQLHMLAGFLSTLFILIGLFFVAAIAEFSLFKGIIWSRLVGTRFSLKDFWQMALLNYGLLCVAIVIALFSIIKLNNNVLFVIIGMATLHFNTIILFSYARTRSIKKSIKALFWTGCRFHKFVVPYAVIGFMVVILRFLVLPRLDQFFKLLVMVMIALPLISWARNYYAHYTERFIWKKEDR
ncbi:MAG: hypothetical protein V1837_04035 [Candidatus Woesearchaeota archaeon]